MKKLTIDQLELQGKRVLTRVDFNVPLDEYGNITDDRRIVAALPTIEKIIRDGGKAILMSHLGRPKGERKPEYSLAPVAKRLSELLDKEIIFVDDCIGDKVKETVANMQNGDVVLLENLRFYPGETKNDPDFAKQLAELGDVYVNDAFGTAHRAHASTEGVTHYIEKCAAGYLMQKELDYLGNAIENPRRPFTAILGGAKVSGKIDVIKNLFSKVDYLLIGGGMVFTFLKAEGYEVGKSLVEEDKIELAKEILEKAENKNVGFILPTDVVCAKEFSNDSPAETYDIDNIPDDMMGLDIGPKTVRNFKEIILMSKTVVWNGPMGVFEFDNFAKGTREIAEALADATAYGATTIVGGGDSAAAMKKFKLEHGVSHVSTGGGASLEFLEGKELPGVAALTDVD
jgi:phosphoglycerate kinase